MAGYGMGMGGYGLGMGKLLRPVLTLQDEC